ncbi:MAG: PilZ domain-containing protein [Desulfobacterales bacterium]|nr:MAG: PilZ domain-containing protein [Desulfobacterales bacterium]UCD89360.1 MAG: PilZ domain-containing protein [Desulfobacterales bacterium]
MKKELDRRKYSRREFKPKEKPTLKIGKIEFEIIDISERGLRFINKHQINLEGWVSGTLTFSNRHSIEIDGIIVRKKKNEIGMHLVEPIDI